jgi:hypothetical protein
MTGGESKVGNADLNSLLLDFMRVISAQHELFYSEPLGISNASVRMNLRHVAELYGGLGLKQQPTSVLWILIVKLYRLQCLQEANFYYNGGKDMDVERFFNYHFDYKLMDDEVELVLVPDRFKATLHELEGSRTAPYSAKPASYTCRLFRRDNRVMLALNDIPFQVAKVNSGSIIEDLLRDLERLPSSEVLSAINFKPSRSDISFPRILDKYGYRWLMPMLTVCQPKAIAIQNPIDLDVPTVLAMLPEIAEIYRQPLAAYLGVEQTTAH